MSKPRFSTKTTQKSLLPGFELMQLRAIHAASPASQIAKHGKKGGHHGRPCSMQYWSITCEQLSLAFEWNLDNNDTFDVHKGDGSVVVVVQQRRGLPIGGHLSAAYIELVAMREDTNAGGLQYS